MSVADSCTISIGICICLCSCTSGSALTTGADGVIVLPQLSSTVGAVGATASAGHATVDAPSAGSVTVGALMVYV